MKIKGAIFDLDGTLVDSLMFWDLTWEKVGRKYLGKEGFHPGPELAKTVQTVIIDEAAAYINEVCQLNADVEEFQRYIIFLLEEFYKTVAKPKKGAFELLDYLKDNGIKICVASATPLPYVKTALKACGLADYFDIVLSCADIGKGKAFPDIYLKALELLGTPVEDTAVFEDSFVALRTAKGVGIHAIGLYDKYNSNKDLEGISELYMAEGEDLTKFIGIIEA